MAGFKINSAGIRFRTTAGTTASLHRGLRMAQENRERSAGVPWGEKGRRATQRRAPVPWGQRRAPVPRRAGVWGSSGAQNPALLPPSPACPAARAQLCQAQADSWAHLCCLDFGAIYREVLSEFPFPPNGFLGMVFLPISGK